MHTLVLYDSLYGNTHKLAQAIHAALPAPAVLLRVTDIDVSTLHDYDLIFFGAPSQGAGPSDNVKTLLHQLPVAALSGPRFAVFDTRIPWWNPWPAEFAAPFIAHALERHFGAPVLAVEGFAVADVEGPLKEGELERATAWAQQLYASASAAQPA